MIVAAVVVGLALAEGPLPSLRDDLEARAVDEVAALVEAGRYAEAARRAAAIESTVAPSAGLAHLRGIALRRMGDGAEAVVQLRRAVALDADLLTARVELGDALVAIEARDEARAVYEELTQRDETGPTAWLGPRRLAELDVAAKDPMAMETHLRLALRRGLTFRDVCDLPVWRRAFRDERLAETLRRMVTAFGDPADEQCFGGDDSALPSTR